MKRGHVACAALLNPSSAEPLVWPSALKFISELEPNAKSLLEAALMEANRERERRILKGAKNALPSPSHSDDGAHDTTIAEVNSEFSIASKNLIRCYSSWSHVSEFFYMELLPYASADMTINYRTYSNTKCHLHGLAFQVFQHIATCSQTVLAL